LVRGIRAVDQRPKIFASANVVAMTVATLIAVPMPRADHPFQDLRLGFDEALGERYLCLGEIRPSIHNVLQEISSRIRDIGFGRRRDRPGLMGSSEQGSYRERLSLGHSGRRQGLDRPLRIKAPCTHAGWFCCGTAVINRAAE
jgi:hypothetical protein